jgi:hypothetical protein
MRSEMRPLEIIERKDILDVVEPELVNVFCRCNNANPVTKCVLLQELFGQILEIAFGQWDVGCDCELVVAYVNH